MSLKKQKEISKSRGKLSWAGELAAMRTDNPPVRPFTKEDFERATRMGRFNLVDFGKPRGKEAW